MKPARSLKKKEEPKDTRHSRPEYGTLPFSLGSPGRSGSIEQQLDMCEGEKSPRGDEVMHSAHLRSTPEEELYEKATYEVDLSDENREGDEMSGDDHSNGMEGGDAELANQEHIHRGMPGDETSEQERIERDFKKGPDEKT